MKKDFITSDIPFTNTERETIQAICRMIIPASEEFAVPGADDEQILMATLQQAVEFEDLFRHGVQVVNNLAKEKFDREFTDLNEGERSELIEQNHSPFTQTLTSVTIRSYYMDARVLASLHMEVRPPFPVGNEIEQGDWSLLDAVKKRERFYRDC